MPTLQTDYQSTLTGNMTTSDTTVTVQTPPTNTAGVLCINRGKDNEEWKYMSSVASSTITFSHAGLSKTASAITEVSGNIKAHYAGETIEWVNHACHIINKQGDTVYGDLKMNGTKEMQFNTTDFNISSDGTDLIMKDGVNTVKLSEFATTATKLDDFATPDDNTDLNATTSEHGLLKKLDNNASNFMNGQGGWATPAGGGNVSTTDTSSTDNTIVRESGTSGTNIQKSLPTIDDSGSINIPSGQTYDIDGTSYLSNVTDDAQVKKISSSTDNAVVKWDSTTGAVVQDSGVIIGDTNIITPLRPEQNSSEPSSPTLGQLYYDETNSCLKVYTAWDIANTSYDSKSFDLTSQITTLAGLFFSSDGTKMYASDTSSGIIYQYTLSTAWDISTASYASKSYDVTSEIASDAGLYLFFSSDGTKMYVCEVQAEGATDTIFQYTLSTAWDVSTASYASKNSGNLNATALYLSNYFIKSDGLKLYAISRHNDKVYQYTLSTAWDISTINYDSINVDIDNGGNQYGLFFSSDGTKMYIGTSGTIRIWQYNLSIAWDISTAREYNYKVYNPSASAYFTKSLFFKPDGNKMYFTSTTGGVSIHQFTSNGWTIVTTT